MQNQTRAVIYARYSSERQSDHSIEDQLELCRRLIQREGWQLLHSYEDRAISGAVRQRPAFQQLLSDAERGAFDVVVTEALDRLGRKLADVADLYDRLSFRGIRIVTHATGEVTQLHIGMLGTMAQLYLSDLREKTRRGLIGRVLAGRSAGGLAYGYRVTATGKRAIEENEAAVVRRIFRAFAAGRSPRAIAKALNAEGVPGPGGRPWIDTTIRGQRERGTGILNNDLYAGWLIWNRVSYVKDPRTGKRQARPNPPESWERTELPELRIVDQELWEAVKARQDALGFAIARDGSGQALNRAHRRHFLLSGLLVCGQCGGGYTVMATDRYGCAAHRQRGTCSNDRTIVRQEIEGRVLSGLKERLLAPELFAEFARSYQEELTAAARQRGAAHERAARALADCDKRIAGVIQAIEDGLYSPALKARLAELEAERIRLAVALEATAPAPPIALHPNLPELYRRQVERLEAALNDPIIRDEAAEVLRELIAKVVLMPRPEGKSLDAVLHGDLARILQLCEAADPKSRTRKLKLPGQGGPGSQASVVAGARNQQYRMPEPSRIPILAA